MFVQMAPLLWRITGSTSHSPFRDLHERHTVDRGRRSDEALACAAGTFVFKAWISSKVYLHPLPSFIFCCMYISYGFKFYYYPSINVLL